MTPQRHCLDEEHGSPWGLVPSMFPAARSSHHHRCLATAVQLCDIPVQPVISLAHGLGGAPVLVNLGTHAEPASRHRHLPGMRGLSPRCLLRRGDGTLRSRPSILCSNRLSFLGAVGH
jgi:hypothetical protein